MKMLVCFAFAAVAFADVPTGYDFNVRVVPTERRSGYNVHVNIDAPDGSFAGISETAALPAEQKMTFERNGRTYTVVLRMTSDIQGTADFEVMEKGAVIAHTEKSFGRPLIEKPMPKSFEPPKVLERVEPTYPEEARAARVGGPVVLETRINADGTIGDIRVLRPLGYGIDEAAVAAVRQWKFRPAMQDGKPVSVAYSVTLFFKP